MIWSKNDSEYHKNLQYTSSWLLSLVELQPVQAILVPSINHPFITSNTGWSSFNLLKSFEFESKYWRGEEAPGTDTDNYCEWTPCWIPTKNRRLQVCKILKATPRGSKDTARPSPSSWDHEAPPILSVYVCEFLLGPRWVRRQAAPASWLWHVSEQPAGRGSRHHTFPLLIPPLLSLPLPMNHVHVVTFWSLIQQLSALCFFASHTNLHHVNKTE